MLYLPVLQEAFDPLQHFIVSGVVVLDRVLDLVMCIDARHRFETLLIGTGMLQRVEQNTDCRYRNTQTFLKFGDDDPPSCIEPTQFSALGLWSKIYWPSKFGRRRS